MDTWHDVALLTLRTPVKGVRFAKVQKEACAGCDVVQIGRLHGAKARVLSISKSLHLHRAGESESNVRLGVDASKLTGRGGGLYRASKKGDRVLVGLVVGQRKTSGQGVVVPLTDGWMGEWITAIVASAVCVSMPARASGCADERACLRKADEAPSGHPADGARISRRRQMSWLVDRRRGAAFPSPQRRA